MSSTMPNTRTPWDKLIQAFVENNTVRTRQIESWKYGAIPRRVELKEFRLLKIHGPRQCGKTESLIQFILKNENVKFNIKHDFIPYFKRRLGEDKFNQCYLSDDALNYLSNYNSLVNPPPVENNPFENIKVMLFDNASNDALFNFTELFNYREDLFDKEIMIISID